MLATDTATGEYGYQNTAGKTVVPFGKYSYCFTDTFRTYAMVIKPGTGIVAINRQERILYAAYIFDNGPDEAAEGVFRMRKNGKIGYANEQKGTIVIPAQFAGAWPFHHGVAKVSLNCRTSTQGEHHSWIGGDWYYINKAGVRVGPPKE